MPELPEVETVARQLAPLVRDRTVVGLRVFDPSLKRGRFPRVAGRHVIDVARSGKRVLFRFSPCPDRSDELWRGARRRPICVPDSVWTAGRCCFTTRDDSERFGSTGRSRKPYRTVWTHCPPG